MKNKETEKERLRIYYLNNKDKVKQRSKLWAKNNPERRKEIANKSAKLNYKGNSEEARVRALKWQRDNPEKVYEKNKEWRINNPEKMSLARKRWRDKNKDKCHEYKQCRRARENNAFVESVNRIEVYNKHHGICGICKLPVSIEKFDMDHIIPISKGGKHKYSNCQPSHPRCNNQKGNKIIT